MPQQQPDLPSIGPYTLANRVILAPMAGVTDRPFRQLCRRLGAGLVVSEMVTSDPSLWHTRKSRLRLDHSGEPGPRSVQIAGGDANMLAQAARLNAEQGAQIIDINMGCPAKKVCNKAAGSALLRDEPLVADILNAVVSAVEVPVTLKIRTGWCPQSINAVRIARMAEDAGIAALAVHGRTRDQRYAGQAEYDTIAQVKAAVKIPVFANGDIDSPLKAADVLDYTGADAVMIGRGAQGNPWIFREIDHYLVHGRVMTAPSLEEQAGVMRAHLEALHGFYGHTMGVRIARKHLGWYLSNRLKASPQQAKARRTVFNALKHPRDQLLFVDELFSQASPTGDAPWATDGISAA
ncbi:tRNA dihydrouridine synthase DusB [Litchfieldella xinjiangensis]|uniref:tRNA dihydrouridine synthase DusB n=1 Tax=Litchfieldella xinjiangensis TaxID=1166948 RepID=UPI0005BABF60|nr:tRNA dihydrouridine synthase DusB [Halomonas xinjiangensis]